MPSSCVFSSQPALREKPPEIVSLTYTLEQVEQVLARFAPDLLGAEFHARSHDCSPCKRGARGVLG